MVELGGWTGPAECGYPDCWRSFGRGCARMVTGRTQDCPKPPQVREPVNLSPTSPACFILPNRLTDDISQC